MQCYIPCVLYSIDTNLLTGHRAFPALDSSKSSSKECRKALWRFNSQDGKLVDNNPRATMQGLQQS